MATDSSPLYWPHDAPVICLDKNNVNIQCTPLFLFLKKFYTKAKMSKNRSVIRNITSKGTLLFADWVTSL